MSNFSYKAKNLSDIANMFNQFAVEAHAWAEAARILRQTTLEDGGECFPDRPDNVKVKEYKEHR